MPTLMRRYFKEVRLRQLRALVELARHGSFTRAAKSLKLSAPSVWQQVRALEEAFDVSLIAMRGQKVELTEDGTLLVELSAPIVESFDSLRPLFLDRRKLLARQLTVATTGSLLANELRPPLELFRRTHPEVRLEFIDRPSAAARELLERGQADLAVVGQLDGVAANPLFESSALTTYPFMLVCPKGHPLIKRRSLGLGELARQPLVLPGEGANSRAHVDAVFREAGLASCLNVVMSASTLPLLTGYVSMGFGISVTSVSPAILRAAKAGAKEYAGLEFREVRKLFGEEKVVLLSRRGRLELPHVKAFCETVTAALRHST